MSDNALTMTGVLEALQSRVCGTCAHWQANRTGGPVDDWSECVMPGMAWQAPTLRISPPEGYIETHRAFFCAAWTRKEAPD